MKRLDDAFRRRTGRGCPAAAQAQECRAAGRRASSRGILTRCCPSKVLLKDYRPKSVYKIPVSDIKKAKFPVIDCHHHAPPRTPEQVDEEIKIMDGAGVESSVAFMPVGEEP